MNNIDESTNKIFDASEIEERDKLAERLNGNYIKGTTYADGCKNDNDPYLGGTYNNIENSNPKPYKY